MKITLTGASGFIGNRLTTCLLEQGHSLHILGRRTPESVPKHCEFFAWDALSSTHFPAEALQGVNAVIHLAGEPVAQRWSSAAKRRIRITRVDGTNQLIDALTKVHPRPELLISASAIGYYGDRGDEILTETSLPGSGFLAAICADWERCAAKAQAIDMRVVRLRLGIVLGREGGALAKMLPLFRIGLGASIGTGRQWMSWVHVDDVIGLILFALHKHDVTGALNVTAPNPVRNSEFTKTLGAALHRPAFLPAPAFALKLAYGEMATMLTGGQRVEPALAQRAGYPFHFPHLDRAFSNLLQS